MGGFGPDEWFGMLVAEADVVAEGRLRRARATIRAAT